PDVRRTTLVSRAGRRSRLTGRTDGSLGPDPSTPVRRPLAPKGAATAIQRARGPSAASLPFPGGAAGGLLCPRGRGDGVQGTDRPGGRGSPGEREADQSRGLRPRGRGRLTRRGPAASPTPHQAPPPRAERRRVRILTTQARSA